MKFIYFSTAVLLCNLEMQAQLFVGGGVVAEKNDYQSGVQAIAQYNLSKRFALRTTGQYFFCCNIFDNYSMLNADVFYNAFISEREQAWSLYTGLNLYPGKSFEVLGQRFRGNLLYGWNMGLEYSRKILKQRMHLNAKYIQGHGYRDLELSL